MNLDDIVFDQHSRYQVCADILTQLAQGQPLRILDVGSGGECLLGRFLPQADITYVDPLLADHPSPTDKMIPAGFFDAKLDEGSFDCVVSIDFLEHIPLDRREAFLVRSAQVAKKAIVLLCPCGDEGDAEGLDRFIADGYRQVTDQEYPWLLEHAEMGLPLATDVMQVLQGLGWRVQRTANGHVPWLKDLLLPVLCLWDHGAQDRVLDLSRDFIREFGAYDSIPPCYRQIFIARPAGETAEIEVESRMEMPSEIQARWSEFRRYAVETMLRHLHDEHQRAHLAEQSSAELSQRLEAHKSEAAVLEQKIRSLVSDCLATGEDGSIDEDADQGSYEAVQQFIQQIEEHIADLQRRALASQEELRAIKGSLSHRMSRSVLGVFDRFRRS